MPAAKDGDILRHIAREEPLTSTLKSYGLSREALTRLLERAAELVDQAPAPPRKVEAAPSPPVKTAAAPGTRIRVYSDGAARGNPGPAGAGAVLVAPDGQVVDRLGKYLGVQTNNFAEYMGLLLGLGRARELGVTDVEVYADSELMIRQLDGKYQVKSPTLRPLYEDARRLLKSFSRVKLVHVPRELNKPADEMSNRAIDERM
ncbi:MAG: ribonuclease HI family protein [Myxococcaceae bacterium]